MEIAILALGCFWGPEIKFSKLKGIIKTEVGYCGGNNKNTTYKEVCTGNTNHAEVVKLDFDSNLISYEKILDYFFDDINYKVLGISKAISLYQFYECRSPNIDRCYEYIKNNS